MWFKCGVGKIPRKLILHQDLTSWWDHNEFDVWADSVSSAVARLPNHPLRHPQPQPSPHTKTKTVRNTTDETDQLIDLCSFPVPNLSIPIFIAKTFAPLLVGVQGRYVPTFTIVMVLHYEWLPHVESDDKPLSLSVRRLSLSSFCGFNSILTWNEAWVFGIIERWW